MNTLEETIERLAERPGRARLVAGGTDLIADLEEKVAEKEQLTLLDISRIEEILLRSQPLSRDRFGDHDLELAASSLIQVKARHARGAGWLGSPIRNVATIGGNVVNAGRRDTTLPSLLWKQRRASFPRRVNVMSRSKAFSWE
jgi:CO/xanthine dehydrogenase FAD-binding subunit